MATHRRDESVFGIALALGALALIGVVASAPARADTESYLQKLHEIGINTPGGDVELKEWGWEVCALFIRGFPPDKVLQQAVYNSGASPQYGMSVEQADAVVHIATTDLCDARE